MSGRGRGRGFLFRPLFGGAKPEDAFPPTGQPPPLYPPLKFKPIPLPSGKRISYLLNLKQEIRSAIRESAYYVPPISTKKDIERYTDKYQQMQAADEIEWDKNLFPKELFEEPAKKKRKIVKKAAKKEAVVEKLKVLEAKESEDTEKDENDDSEQEIEPEEEEYDEELEEETDYANNYFDNGENYLDEDDDNDEGYE